MPRRKPEFTVRPNTPDGPAMGFDIESSEMGMDIESGFDVASGRRDIHLRFVALDADGLVDPDVPTLYYCDLDVDTARAAAKELERMAG